MDNVKTIHRLRLDLVAALLVLWFGTLSAFSPVLHDHEFDLAHVDKNCASCQWVQSHMAFDTPSPGLTVSWFFQPPLFVSGKIFFKKLVSSVSSRSPPLLSKF